MIRDSMAWARLCPAMCMLISGAPAVAQHQPTITTIDAPGAGATSGYGTEGSAMNQAGVVTGYYVGYDNVVHAFVWAPDSPGLSGVGTPFRWGGDDGSFITFDGPGVPSSVPNDPFSPPDTWINTSAPGTYAAAIDAMGAVTGYYVDANYVARGFLRAPDGKFTSFEAPYAGSEPGQGQGTFATNMNLQGTIAGYYVDANNGSHGFVRTRDGAITEFDVPGAIGNTWLGWAQCISATGAVAGTYFDSAGQSYGFVRDPGGKAFSTFEYIDPDQNQDLIAWSGQGTNIWGINAAGTTVGAFVDANNVYHGLVRTSDGKITVFDAPRAATGAHTVSEAINEEGAVVGFYNDANGVHHGFLRSADGRFTYFDDSNGGDQFHQGTVPMFIIEDAVAGFYEDGDYVWHGFVRN